MVDMETIKAVAQLIAERYQPERVVLFGSYATGRAGRHSDVDLLVELDDARAVREPDDPIRLAVNERFQLPMDIVVCTPDLVRQQVGKHYTVIGQALKHGIILYERKAA